MEEKAQSKSNQKWIIILLLLLIVLLGVVLVVVLGRSNTQSISDDDTPLIGYAADATVMLDEASLQAAMDEAMKNASEGNVALRYKNSATSDDGVNFACYLANSPANRYDAFFTIYADAAMTDQVYLSGLVRPGSGFENITLDHALDSGTTTVYVAVTLVDTEEDGTQTIKAQVVHTMDFYVA
ncbi:MAG: hypothetical protein HDT20_08730 [Oscillibacter sp.]|nr:hypothetical protein [Oscillibacter sp.]